jgi:hypothetical protein
MQAMVDVQQQRADRGGEDEGFLDREQKCHAAQLNAYAAALGGACCGL